MFVNLKPAKRAGLQYLRQFGRIGVHGRNLTSTSKSGSPITQMTDRTVKAARSEEHTSELQSLMRISYAVFCLKKTRPLKIVRKSTRTNTIHYITYRMPPYDYKKQAQQHNNTHIV